MESIETADVEKRLQAVRAVKHCIIGSQAKKTELVLMGAVPKLIGLLRSKESVTDLLVEVITVLGSLAHGTPETVQAILSANALPLLFEGMLRQEEPLVIASARTLCTLYLSGRAPSDVVYENHEVVTCLVRFLQSSSMILANSAATIISQSCVTSEHRTTLALAGVLPSLSTLIRTSQRKDVFQTAIEALSAVVLRNRETSQLAVNVLNFLSVLSEVLSSGHSPQVKLGAAECLTNLYRSDAVSEENEILKIKVLPTLIKYCRKTMPIEIRIKALQVLAFLLEDSSSLQELAADSERIISNLVTNLDSQLEKDDYTSDVVRASEEELQIQLKEGSLEVLAALSTHKEELRSKILQHKKVLMKHIVAGLQGEELGLKLAALKCVLFWSRSPQHLRTTLADCEIWKHLLDLLAHKDESILILATSALCNFLLPVSASRKRLVDGGVLKTAFHLISHSDVAIKTNIVWSLMNLTHQGLEPAVRQKFDDHLALQSLLCLCSETGSQDIQLKALCVIGNIFATDPDTIERLLNDTKDAVRDLVFQLLSVSDNDDLTEHVLILILNIGSGTHKCKMTVLEWDDFMRMAATKLKDPSTSEQLLTPLIAVLTVLADCDTPNAIVRHNKLEEYMIKYSLQKRESTASDSLLPLVLSLISTLSDGTSS